MSHKFTVVSTFSGGGGSSLGYKLAGGKIMLACDFDKNAIETYKKNYPDTPVFFGDVTNLSVEEIFKITNLKEGELDIFDGSPPCQGFSSAGKRNMSDKRNDLFLQFCRILKGLKPKVFVMENVSGMIKGNMKFIFVEILKSLKNCGYKVKAKLLNAKYYNVPQSRQRLIFIGVRDDIDIEPSHPEPSNKIITLRECLKNCSEGDRLNPKGFTATIVHKIKQGEAASDYHPKKSYFSNIRVSWDKPSPTITKTCDFGIFLHPEINQSLSIPEVKRIFTFPDDYILTGSFKEQWARLGNCVPPFFMKAIAENIYENILSKIQK